MHPEAVPLAGAYAAQVAVPDEAVDLGQGDAFLGTARVKEAQLDALGDLGEKREVGPDAVVGGTQRITGARPC